MRKFLQQKENERLTFCATVERFGKKSSYKGYPKDTILLKNVVFEESGEIATNHIWFTVGERIADLNLSTGDKIKFDARIKFYIKGYINERTKDYKLSHPTKMEIIE